MSFRSCGLLQFDELKELLATFAGSAAGRDLVDALEPHRNRPALEHSLAETAEAIIYAGEAADLVPGSGGAPIRLRFDQLRDVSSAVRLLQIDGPSLEGREILDLFANLALAGEYRAVLLSLPARFPLLAGRASHLADLRPTARRYARAFLPDGSLADEASVALTRIRRDIEKQGRTIHESLDRFLRTHRADGTLQDELVTVREGRYVVPIVAGQKGRVDGVIHGSSGTGRTLFVEPLETVSLNNQLVRLHEDELREIERILAEITGALREHRTEIASTAETLAELDCTFAKAGFARSYQATVPRFSSGPRHLLLREARHPLLETVLRKQRKPITPVSFELTEANRCLLISGPNTGGKTVTMKTAGLLALMAHAAIPVPAAEAEFPLLDDVLADIGDAQSIAESLSSFSGHLTHVKAMLAEVTPDSLVLLDELGRATDPEEGGALGVAVLDQFRQSGAFCLASTHLLPLKLYGTHTPGVVNASMGFNEATLQPTYVLKLGVPGKSAGLDIATRLELPAPLLAHARDVLPRMQADFQALLSELHRQVEDNRTRSAELETATAALRERQSALEAEAVHREAQRQRDWGKRTEQMIAQFEERAASALDRLSDLATQRKASEQAQRLVSKITREFRAEATESLAPPPELAKTAAPPRPEIVEGARVRLRDIRELATVRRILKSGLLEVEAGFLKMQVPRADVLEVVSAVPENREKLKNVRFEAGPAWNVSYREINLLGQRAEEALENVDKFLDSAALASVGRVRIIHGHGMGVLKRAVNDALGSNPHVSRFYPATADEGGSGATIVELRD